MGLISRAWTNLAPPGAITQTCRRVAPQYDKLAANYLASIKLASIRIWLRVNEPAP